jgi:tetratricopeptide (TPR) repeat protein
MSEHNNQVPGALVAVGTKALAVRSATLVKRGLALAESLQPGDAEAHLNLGNALFKKGDWDGAIAEFRVSASLQPQKKAEPRPAPGNQTPGRCGRHAWRRCAESPLASLSAVPLWSSPSSFVSVCLGAARPVPAG